MQFTAKAFAGVLALTLAFALPASALHTFSATLTGDQEVPPNESPFSGTGTFILSDDEDSLEFSVDWSGLSAAFTGAHIHQAPPGEAGPIVIDLVPFVSGNSAEGTVELTDELADLLHDGQLYVNVHSAQYPGGELRGQIIAEADTIFFAPDDIGESACLHLIDDTTRPAVVCVGPVGMEEFPIIVIAVGCGAETGCEGSEDCDPATFFREYTYVWEYTNGNYYRTFVGDGCVCITLEGIVPVEFGRLTAEARDGEVLLRWNTRSETDLNRFEITRFISGRQESDIIGSVPANNLPTGGEYEFVDRNAAPGSTYRYVLSVVDLTGGRTDLATVEASPRPSDNASEVTEYALYDNYPNPFNPETQIRFDLAEGGLVKLTVFDVLGRQVATILNTNMAKGQHAVNFSAGNLATGLYVYRIEVNGFTDQRKMLLMK